MHFYVMIFVSFTDLAATPTDAPGTSTPPSPVPTETPFFQQAAFIVGMIVLGVVLLVVIIAVIIFIVVRPRGDSPYKTTTPPTELGNLTTGSQGYNRVEHTPSPQPPTPQPVTPSPKHMTGSWSPGDPYDVSESKTTS